MHRGEGDMKIEVGIRVMQPEMKEHQECWQHPKLEGQASSPLEPVLPVWPG